MRLNLESLRDEIQHYLDEQGFAVFHGYLRAMDSVGIVYWDSERYPDFRAFLDSARGAGVRLIVFGQQDFSSDQVEEALEQLETCELPLDEYRSMERRLKEMRAYDGFTCALELSFGHEDRTYMFEVRTEWYQDFSSIMDDVDMLGGDITDEDDNTMGGYFSKN